MKKNILSAITCLLVSSLGSAQVLFEEDFNSYPAGHLNTDYTGTTTGQGGWLVDRDNTATAMVTPEAGKGNVLTITNNLAFHKFVRIRQDDGIIDALWNNRTAGNNVAKFEFEIYGSGFFDARGILGESPGAGYAALRFYSMDIFGISTWYRGGQLPLLF